MTEHASLAGHNEPSPTEQASITFGIYPGSATSGSSEIPQRPNDNLAQIDAALTCLQGAAPHFIVRGYMQYVGNGNTVNKTPAAVELLVNDRRRLDLVLCFRDPDSDIDAWCDFIRATVQQYGPYLASLQITEEPNNPRPEAGGDGSTPRVIEAIAAGIPAAKRAAREFGYQFEVGFNATPSFDMAGQFWTQIGQIATASFLEALDYVGFDFFPDVFRPLAPDGEPGDIRSSVTAVLNGYRNTSLRVGNIPAHIPIHVCENGWPTGEHWSYERQSAILDMIVRIIAEHRAALNITQYIYFDLRDEDSANPDRFQHFGLMRDDYAPKPAFETYRRLVSEFGAMV